MTLMSARALDSTSFETIHAQQKYIWSLLQMSMINYH
jgi:hypothetical protein